SVVPGRLGGSRRGATARFHAEDVLRIALASGAPLGERLRRHLRGRPRRGLDRRHRRRDDEPRATTYAGVLRPDLAAILQVVGADDHLVVKWRRRLGLELRARATESDDGDQQDGHAGQRESKALWEVPLAYRFRPDLRE